MEQIDINSDMGESFGTYKMGDDEALLKVVSSANVACGFHAGDPMVMDRTVRNALAEGVSVGAHPGFMDIQGFGRRQIQIDNFVELEKMVVYQIGALMAIARACGHKVTHVKFHGALAHMGFADKEIAQTLVRAVKSIDPEMLFLALPHTQTEAAAERAGLRVAREIFADRVYTDNGMLQSRTIEGAVIKDAELAASRVMQMLEEGALVCASGKRIPTRIDSVCVHGDTPGAVAMAMALREKIEAAGIKIVPMY
ncbi:MAG: 5-oxoprolinase subunit PxpA [Sulfuriferula multivorans]|uniref:5-oxoprolinase subunit A n=1 Tax=Sulfuriferula multivorans TaxID=1559896 RepID=A0A7C9JV13_9PROT|nr:5-oxoprolinase subunit PxpA [Sulfuriferula multivorans]